MNPLESEEEIALEFLVQWGPLILIFVLMYFMMIRPQQHKRKRQEMLNSLKVGDEIVTIGGLHGVIQALDDGPTTRSG